MPRFFTGDELGVIKSISFAPGDGVKEWKAFSTTVLAPGSSAGRSKTVQKLVLHHTQGLETLLAAVRADGSAAVHKSQNDSQFAVVHEWSETRLKTGQMFVGLAATDERSIFTCTSNGALRLTKIGQDGSEASSSFATLPTRLCEWRLSKSGQAFAYGGDEVELSLWDAERAFSQEKEDVSPSAPALKKRKRAGQSLPGELWRAKNVPNDHLSLRQPVHNTALTFLQPSSSTAHQHLLLGTANGNVRRYDTRAGRRPVSDWKGVGKTGGVKVIEKGTHEHEVYVADCGCSLSAVDLRNGRTTYTYKEISGAVTSVAPTQSHMASASQDRFIRFHSTFPPPEQVGQQQEHKGDVLEKLYMKVTPTVIVWDGVAHAGHQALEPEDEGGDDIWATMLDVDSDS